jgi:hypothetical protein
MTGIRVASHTQPHVQNTPLAIVGSRKDMLAGRGAVSRTGVSQSQVVRCTLKAFCLAFASFVVLIAPAAATEAIPPTTSGVQSDEAATASLQTILQKITSEDAGAQVAADNPADAEFANKVGAMLALAKDEVRRAAAAPHPVRIDVRLRCVAKRVTAAAPDEQPSSFVPAVQWSVVDANGYAQPAPAPAPAATRLVRACAFQLLRRDAMAEQSPEMRPYTVELPVVLTEQAR